MLRQALAMNEKLRGASHDTLVPILNSIAMIDGYLGRIPQALDEIGRAEDRVCPITVNCSIKCSSMPRISISIRAT